MDKERRWMVASGLASFEPHSVQPHFSEAELESSGEQRYCGLTAAAHRLPVPVIPVSPCSGRMVFVFPRLPAGAPLPRGTVRKESSSPLHCSSSSGSFRLTNGGKKKLDHFSRNVDVWLPE